MAKANQTWTVLPHGPIEKLSENVWRVEAGLPNMPLKRVMVVVRLRDGRLLIHNACALDEPSMKEIEAWGTPSFLVVPNGWHRLDAKVYRQRYPQLQVVTPPGARKKVAEVVPVDLDYSQFQGDDTVSLETLDGVKGAEGVLRVRSSDGETLVFTDGVFNLPRKFPGLFGFIYGAIGSKPGPRVTPLFKLFAIKDKDAYRAHLERLAAEPTLRRVIVAHGDPVRAGAGEFLRTAAGTLG